MILEPCSKGESPNMAILDGSSTTYFYLHLSIIYDLGVLIVFMTFEVEFSAAANVDPSQITPNVSGIIRTFEIIL